MPDMLDMSCRLLVLSDRELRPCRTFCPAGFKTHTISDKENKNDHRYLPVINCEKCLTAAQNVRHSADDLPDILSGTSEIIFAITAKQPPPPPCTRIPLYMPPQLGSRENAEQLNKPLFQHVIGSLSSFPLPRWPLGPLCPPVGCTHHVTITCLLLTPGKHTPMLGRIGSYFCLHQTQSSRGRRSPLTPTV